MDFHEKIHEPLIHGVSIVKVTLSIHLGDCKDIRFRVQRSQEGKILVRHETLWDTR